MAILRISASRHRKEITSSAVFGPSSRNQPCLSGYIYHRGRQKMHQSFNGKIKTGDYLEQNACDATPSISERSRALSLTKDIFSKREPLLPSSTSPTSVSSAYLTEVSAAIRPITMAMDKQISVPLPPTSSNVEQRKNIIPSGSHIYSLNGNNTNLPNMILRRNFLPHILPDISATLFLSICVAITFWFELFVVVPEFHAPGSLVYNLTFAAAVFLLVNVKGNMLAVMLIDTSIKGRILTPPEEPEQKKLWRLCSVCETMAPPRSWHCNTCKTCILKRDHHCLFTGCCIGHHNHRFFMMLVLFIFIGSMYATFYNHYFIWYHHGKMYKNYWTILKLIMPLFMLTLDASSGNFYLAIFELNLIAIAISGMLLLYHGKIILKGGVVHERKKPMYNLGWKKNLEIVFGERWYLVWILPFIESKLPHDGIHWETVGLNSVKNR